MKWLKPGKNNKEERMNFVKYWAKFVRENPDNIWGEQQNVLIDSQFVNPVKMSAKEYLKMKKEWCSRE